MISFIINLWNSWFDKNLIPEFVIGDLDGGCERLIERTQKNWESIRSEFRFRQKIDDDEDTRVPLWDYTIIGLSI